jgi:transcriptional regulator with XRE-family HTH domain
VRAARHLGARREALSAFLKDRRAHLPPRRFGIPTARSRRVPGLTRPEAAALIGIGPSYYTWIEQGRPINVSDDVLERIADVFGMNDAERRYLIAAARPSRELRESAWTLAPRIHALLEALDPLPAFVMTPRADLLARNRALEALFVGNTSVGKHARNLLWLAFCNPYARPSVANRAEIAPRLVAAFRAAYAGHIGQASFETLLDDLIATSDEFARLWEQQAVDTASGITIEVVREPVGRLVFQTAMAAIDEAREQELVMLVPAPRSGTKERLREFLQSIEDARAAVTSVHRCR